MVGLSKALLCQSPKSCPLNSGESSGQIWLTKENQEQLLEALCKDADKETLKDLQAGAKAVGYLTLGVPREKTKKTPPATPTEIPMWRKAFGKVRKPLERTAS